MGSDRNKPAAGRRRACPPAPPCPPGSAPRHPRRRAPPRPPHVHTARPELCCCAPPWRFGGETSAKPSPPAGAASAWSRPTDPFQGLEGEGAPGVRVGKRVLHLPPSGLEIGHRPTGLGACHCEPRGAGRLLNRRCCSESSPGTNWAPGHSVGRRQVLPGDWTWRVVLLRPQLAPQLVPTLLPTSNGLRRLLDALANCTQCVVTC